MGGWFMRTMMRRRRGDGRGHSINLIKSQQTCYGDTSLTRKRTPLGPYSRNMPRAPWWSWEAGLFLMSEVPLHAIILINSQQMIVASVVLCISLFPSFFKKGGGGGRAPDRKLRDIIGDGAKRI